MSRRSSTASNKKTRSTTARTGSKPAATRKRAAAAATADSSKRAPLGAGSSKAAKLAGRADSPELIPAYIRAVDVDVDQEDRAYLRRKLGRKLGKYAHNIQRVSVRIVDVNGPRGGIDQHCVIKVILVELPTVLVEASSATVQEAMDAALARVERAVKHALERRRAKPLRGRQAGRHQD